MRLFFRKPDDSDTELLTRFPAEGGTGDYAGLAGGGTAAVTTTVHSWYGWILGYSYTYTLSGSVS